MSLASQQEKMTCNCLSSPSIQRIPVDSTDTNLVHLGIRRLVVVGLGAHISDDPCFVLVLHRREHRIARWTVLQSTDSNVAAPADGNASATGLLTFALGRTSHTCVTATAEPGPVPSAKE